MLLGELRSLQEAAVELGVSRARLRQRLLRGEVLGVKRAGSWFIPSLEVKRWGDMPRAEHRPFSPGRAWQVIGGLANDEAEPVSLDLAARLHARAERQALYAHPGLLAKIGALPQVVLGGIDAIEQAALLGEYPVADIYVGRSDASKVFERLGVRPAVDEVNLVAHLVADLDVVPRLDHDRVMAAGPVAALDLMEGYDARVRALGRDRWVGLGQVRS